MPGDVFKTKTLGTLLTVSLELSYSDDTLNIEHFEYTPQSNTHCLNNNASIS